MVAFLRQQAMSITPSKIIMSLVNWFNLTTWEEDLPKLVNNYFHHDTKMQRMVNEKVLGN